MTLLASNHQVTAKEAEIWIPNLEEMAGNDDVKNFLLQQEKEHPPEGDANVLIEGTPGTGKTAILLSYIRRRLMNPTMFDPAVKTEAGVKQRSEYDQRFWQTKRGPGNLHAFVMINGATDSRELVESKANDAIEALADHTFVMADELGELYFRGLDEILRPMLTAPNVTTYATAQNFHSRRRSDTSEEESDRLRALLRRFSHRFRTSNPTPAELLRHLLACMKRWGIRMDSPDTLRLLIKKSGGVVGYARRMLVKAIGENGRVLNRSLVTRAEVDPIYS